MKRPLAMHFNEILPSLLIIRFLIAENVLNKLHLEKVQMGIAFIFLKIHLFDLASTIGGFGIFGPEIVWV